MAPTKSSPAPWAPMMYTPNIHRSRHVSDLSGLREDLATGAHPEGGWGYVPGQPAHPEPTCLALLALAGDAERFAAPIATGVAALQRDAAADGSYRSARGRGEAVWPTALALFARASLGHTGLERTVE